MRLMQLVVGLMLTLVCAGILAGCEGNNAPTSQDQIQLKLRFVDEAGTTIVPSVGTTTIAKGKTLKAIGFWTPNPLPIAIDINVVETSTGPGGLIIENGVNGIAPTLSTQIVTGKTYKVTATAKQGAFNWKTNEYVFVVGDPKFSQVTVFDETVGDMAQILPDKLNHFYVPAGHNFRIGASTTWYHPRTTWNCPGELNALTQTANGFKTTVNGNGIIVVTVTNLDTGEDVDYSITITVTGAPDDGGLG